LVGVVVHGTVVVGNAVFVALFLVIFGVFVSALAIHSYGYVPLVLLLWFGGDTFFYMSEGSEDVPKKSKGNHARTYSDYPQGDRFRHFSSFRVFVC
jgi:hypothetical protein